MSLYVAKMLNLFLQVYDVYLDSDAVQQGLKRGTLIQVSRYTLLLFICLHPPPASSAGGTFLCYPSRRQSVHLCMDPCCCFRNIYAFKDFHQTFVIGASWDRDDLLRLWGQRVEGQVHCIANYVKKYHFWGLFPRCLCCALIDFLQTFAASASWNLDELFSFWGQKVIGYKTFLWLPSGLRHTELDAGC